jgi:hypothetical protein
MGIQIEVVFDGKVFVPTKAIELPVGTRGVMVVWVASPRTNVESPLSVEEKADAERILQGDGTPLPWATVEEALGRPRYEP